MKSKIYGLEAAFCNEGCRDSFKEDRKCGLIYGSCEVDGTIYGWERASVVGEFCAYCRSGLSEVPMTS